MGKLSRMAVRDAVDNALAAAEIVDAFQALHELGGLRTLEEIALEEAPG
jgi:hypothetical protein